MREVTLITRKPEYQGLVALVDDEDYERVTGDDDRGRPLRWNIYQSDRGTRYAQATDAIVDGHRNPNMHRLILNILNDPSKETDHRNHDGLDNQRCNIRACTQSQNNQNARKCKSTSSIYRGIAWHKLAQKWEAYITYDGKRHYLGLFLFEVEAAQAYDAAAKLHHDPAFMSLNFPELAGSRGSVA